MGAAQSQGNDILTLELEVEQARHRRTLSWGERGICQIPESVGTLTQLLELDLFSNQLHHIPDNIGNMMGLVKLDLGNNMVREFPTCICRLVNLQALYIQGNHLTEIPMEFEKVSNLRTLNLSDNDLSDIPICLTKMKFLGDREGASVAAFGALLAGNHFAMPPNQLSWLKYHDIVILLGHGGIGDGHRGSYGDGIGVDGSEDDEGDVALGLHAGGRGRGSGSGSRSSSELHDILLVDVHHSHDHNRNHGRGRVLEARESDVYAK